MDDDYCPGFVGRPETSRNVLYLDTVFEDIPRGIEEGFNMLGQNSKIDSIKIEYESIPWDELLKDD